MKNLRVVMICSVNPAVFFRGRGRGGRGRGRGGRGRAKGGGRARGKSRGKKR